MADAAGMGADVMEEEGGLTHPEPTVYHPLASGLDPTKMVLALMVKQQHPRMAVYGVRLDADQDGYDRNGRNVSHVLSAIAAEPRM